MLMVMIMVTTMIIPTIMKWNVDCKGRHAALSEAGFLC